MAAKKVVKNVTTNKVRFSFANVFEKGKSFNGEGEGKYSVSVIVPKSDKEGVAKIQNIINEVIEENAQGFFGGKTKGLKLWFRDGDEERDDPTYADSYFFTASSYNQPKVVDENRQEILDPTEFYSGCYGRVSISVFPYDSNGARGITFGLNAIQKLEDGERFGGGISAEQAFAD
jgi:Protein of unknown function (DUF2815)